MKSTTIELETTNVLDRHNDYIQIYIIKSQNQIALTDDGYTIADINQSGLFDSKESRELLSKTIEKVGVSQEGGTLKVYATQENLALKKQNLIQAISELNNLANKMPFIYFENIKKFLEKPCQLP